MSAQWNLPLLQRELDLLESGKPFRLPHDVMAFLFGLNRSAVDRVANFAKGHSCDVIFTAEDVLFRKAGSRMT